MRVGPMTPTVRWSLPSHVGRGNQAERPQVGRRVFGADHDGQARAVDVLVQQLHHPFLFFHHLEQRAQRRQRQRCRAPARRAATPRLRRGTPAAAAALRASSAPGAARAPAAGRRASAPAAAARARLRARRRAAGRRTRCSGSWPPATRSSERTSSPASTTFCVTWLPLRDDDDEHARSRRAARIRCAAGRRSSVPPIAKPTCCDGARHHVRDADQQVVDERRTLGLLPQLVLDDGGRTRRLAALEQQSRRTRDSRGRSARGRPRCAADGRSRRPRVARGRCGWSPTTRRARSRARASATSTGSPVSMYSRTSAARSRRDRSESS